ncbi:MAG: tetratricopeptide repeat protein [Candidatus Omnitrophota bacterium]|jgi:tetratricopeptide (TPR) repeat protein
MKYCKVILFLFTVVFSVNAFALTAKEKTSESFAYYYYQKKHYSRAIEEYKSILKNSPRNEKIRYNLACLYVMTKNYPSAIKEFKAIIKSQSPLKKDALYNLTVVYGKYLKDKEGASKYYVQFKKMQK